MNREHAGYLFGGLAFGVLVGFGLYHTVATRPQLDLAPAAVSEPAGPQGPAAPTQIAGGGVGSGGGGGPMIAEVNRLKRMLQDDPDDVEVALRLANLHHDAGYWDQAAGYYERVKKHRPSDPDLLTDLGVCYRGMGEFDRALEEFAAAHRADPGHWQSLFNTVVVAVFDVGRYDVAQQALASIEAIEPPPPGLDPARLDQLRQALAQAAARGQASS
jgi:tetratricopeptide (TPR) repeat protein